MKHKRQLQELTIKDNFMFGAVMADEENCRGLLELVLGIPIKTVKVSREKSIVYHPEYKGVRLDVYAEDEQHTHYDVEMQVAREREMGKRSRYYHSQIDMEMMLSGKDYAELSNVYVIFICDFDPFGEKKYRYTFQNICQENRELSLNDG
ncbi:MAG: Rpn family recombination-promoting nuclease/putative transposase, partial [Acetatifactor sp.]|nr:Rpn family recombination-promoting nuclease/putative transposase [Acetatifactor sp.]